MPNPLQERPLVPVDISGFHEGHDAACWKKLGAHPARLHGVEGFRFAVWAPQALNVSLIGDFNGWHPTPMERWGQSWWHFQPHAEHGQRYKFQVTGADGQVQDRADPFAFWAENRPATASRLLGRSKHRWRDGAWLAERARLQAPDAPVSIYELHLGSWRQIGGRPMTYREIAEPLIHHLRRLAFTHVELMPIAEHPYDPSWGYQVTGYFAPTARYGEPDDLRYLIDKLHQAGIGVLVDWVPAHFPRDGHGLGRFDGTPLYEHPDPRRGEHPDWGTYIFDYGRPEVRSFLLASAHYWLDQLHVDGLRVDAVASMLYLDYSRGPGQWQPNEQGGRENLQAIDFLRTLNRMVQAGFAGAIVAAEESTAFAGVTAHPDQGGLGFQYKWNMGWMHDTLRYFRLDPIARSFHHDWITFSTLYAFSECFCLPLSHDEVVHLKGALVRKMGGPWDHGIAQLRLLYGHQWLHPGKKLLFMGGELAQESEWDQDRELEWHLSGDPMRQGLMQWLGDLNRLYRDHPALHCDCRPEGFQWVEGSDSAASVLVYARRGGGRELVVCLHFTPVHRTGYFLPVPEYATYRVVLSSDLQAYGGFAPEPPPPMQAQERWGRPQIELDLPGYAVLVLEKAEGA